MTTATATQRGLAIAYVEQRSETVDSYLQRSGSPCGVLGGWVRQLHADQITSEIDYYAEPRNLRYERRYWTAQAARSRRDGDESAATSAEAHRDRLPEIVPCGGAA